MKPGIAGIYVNAVIAAGFAGFLTTLVVALFMGLSSVADPLAGSGFERVLSVPMRMMLAATLGSLFGVAIGLTVGATLSASWALIQRRFRLGFLSDLLFIFTVIALYVSLALRASQQAHESIVVVVCLMAIGSVIAAVIFRRLLHLPFDLVLRETLP